MGKRGVVLIVVDLLAPNLNRDKMAYKAQMEREAARKDSQIRKDRDKAALDKQRCVRGCVHMLDLN